MDYKVKSSFQDKETSKVYKNGDLYQHTSADRVAFLVEKGFLEGSEEIVSDNPDFPKHTGGGYYELSNGEKVKGKEDAIAAEQELQKSGE